MLLTSIQFPFWLRGQNANQAFGTLPVSALPQDKDFNFALGVGLSHPEQDFELLLEPWEEGSTWTCGECRVPKGLAGRGGREGGGGPHTRSLGEGRKVTGIH